MLQALSAGSLLAAVPLFHIPISGSLWIVRKKKNGKNPCIKRDKLLAD